MTSSERLYFQQIFALAIETVILLPFNNKTYRCRWLILGTNVCNGVSGSSMTFESNGTYSIRGIVSKGVPKDGQINVCDTREYIIFTDVVHYIDWIKEVVPELNGTSSANIPGIVLISIFEIDQRARRFRT